MKKAIPWLAALFALTFLLAGCSSSSDDDDGISAPDLPEASTITMTGATSAPATAAEAQALYTDSLGALSAFIDSNTGSNSSRFSRANARKTTNESESLNETLTSPLGGSIVLAGSYSADTTVPDDANTFQPNHTYSFSFSMNGDVTGTMESVKVKKGTHTYTICGTLKETEVSNVNVDYKTGATQDAAMSGTVGFSFGIGIGTAVSVVREDGQGAKFVISYAANYGKDDISITDGGEGWKAADDELSDYLSKQAATLTVYDQNNNKISESSLSANDAVSSASIF